MEQTNGFYDFCVPYNNDEKVLRGTLDELVDLGYKTIAIDQSFDHSKMEAAKRGSEIFPEPQAIEYLRKEYADKLRILQRITILYVDVNVSHAMVNHYHDYELSDQIKYLIYILECFAESAQVQSNRWTAQNRCRPNSKWLNSG